MFCFVEAWGRLGRYVVISWIVPYGGSGGQSTTEAANELKPGGMNDPPLLKHRYLPAARGIHLSLCDGELQQLLF